MHIGFCTALIYERVDVMSGLVTYGMTQTLFDQKLYGGWMSWLGNPAHVCALPSEPFATDPVYW